MGIRKYGVSMKLYLASYAMVTMEKIIKREGSNFSKKKAAFIPTAGDPYENKDFVKADKKALQEHGVSAIEIDLKNKNKHELQKVLSKVDIILVAGGDTFYLMEKIKESGADQAIKDFVRKGGIYIGSSAGAIVCCPTIEGAEEFDNPNLAPNLKSFDGMSLFNNVIIPHTHKQKYFERVKRATKKLENKGYKVHPLTDDDVLFFDGFTSIIL